jgi:hypothetical protein
MTARLAKGRKRFAVDIWAAKDTDRDPEVTLYSDDEPTLIVKAQSMMLLMFPSGEAVLYARTDETPDWDTVESKYWSMLRPVPKISGS